MPWCILGNNIFLLQMKMLGEPHKSGSTELFQLVEQMCIGVIIVYRPD